MEKVSIIVPVYNGESRLRRCVESILHQDYPDLEVILVDDGSRDGSLSIMEEYARLDNRVKAIHKENGGVSSARNRAFREATGTYIRFSDVDDWLPMDSTKLLVREMEANPVQLVIGDFYRVVDQNVSQKGSIEKSDVLTIKEYADKMLFSPADLYYGVLWNKLYRREIIERYSIRMDESIRYSEDMIFNLQYLLHVGHIAVLKAPVYYYEYTKGSLLDQSFNLSSTVKMKANVIGHYDNFYKSTFDAGEYEQRLPAIYSFLFALGRDSLALPFLPGTKKLGTETGVTPLPGNALSRSPLQSSYLTIQLFRFYLDSLAKKYRLERDDVLLLYIMEKLGEPAVAEYLASVTGLSRLTVGASLARLLVRGLVSQQGSFPEKVLNEPYVFRADDMREDLLRMEQDYASVAYAGLSDEEIEAYRHMSDVISGNICSHLSPAGDLD